MKYKIHYSCSSHIGNHRSKNQDNFICDGKYLDIDGKEYLFPFFGDFNGNAHSMIGVFDGMGGEECGEIASLIAAKCAYETGIGENPIDDMLGFCQQANERICSYAAENNVGSMGTTAALLYFGKSDIFLCNIGDSKIFRFAKKKLEQISTDHYAFSAYGVKPPLSQNLGIPSTEMIIDPYVAKGVYHDGDIYLICSDGLTDMVTSEEIAGVLKKIKSTNAVDILLKMALERGGKDNITIILCKVERKIF